MAYLDAIGPIDGVQYNRISTDYAHMNAAGGVVFGNMVAELISKSAGERLGQIREC